MTTHARGSFEVKLAPQDAPDSAEGIALGRLTINKEVQGDLVATSKGQMLSSGTESSGSAAYVAIERVTGTLEGRSGSFVLMHSGAMTKDGQQLTVTVAPGSGTGGLAALVGTMRIIIEGKKHLYEFDYTLLD